MLVLRTHTEYERREEGGRRVANRTSDGRGTLEVEWMREQVWIVQSKGKRYVLRTSTSWREERVREKPEEEGGWPLRLERVVPATHDTRLISRLQ